MVLYELINIKRQQYSNNVDIILPLNTN